MFFSSNKENEKMANNHTDKNVKEVRSTGSKMLNGDCWVKEEVEEVSADGEKVVSKSVKVQVDISLTVLS